MGTLAACGGDDSSTGTGDGGGDGGGATGTPWILGTTDAVTSVDPAGAYDFGSWNIEYNIFQQLMTVPANGSDPEPDLAESCDYDDPQTITCTLPEGAKFSNGDDLTSSDVLFSFQRNIEIADPNGASVLLGSISNGDADAPGPGRRRHRDARRHHGRVPPEPARPDVHAGHHLGQQLDRRRGHLPRRRQAGRRRHREHGRLRPLQAEPVQGRRAGGLRGQRDLPGHQDPAGRRRSSSSTSPTRPRSRRPSRAARSTSPGAR